MGYALPKVSSRRSTKKGGVTSFFLKENPLLASVSSVPLAP